MALLLSFRPCHVSEFEPIPTLTGRDISYTSRQDDFLGSRNAAAYPGTAHTSGRTRLAGRPVAFLLRFGQEIVERGLLLALRLRHLLAQPVRLEIPRSLEHFLERLPGTSLQPDAKGSEH